MPGWAARDAQAIEDLETERGRNLREGERGLMEGLP